MPRTIVRYSGLLCMPSRRLQTFCLALFVVCLWWVDKQDVRSLWLLIPTGILAVASFIMGDLVNRWWFMNHPPTLGNYEKNWLLQMVPYFKRLPVSLQDQFIRILALDLHEKEFISMNEKSIPEEWKWMALAPAVYLGMHSQDSSAAHYSRVVFYFHAFPSPFQQQLHISETEHEDGVLIFSLPHLESSYVNPDAYFNTALYEWGIVWERLHARSIALDQSHEQTIALCMNALGTRAEDLKKYLGQDVLNATALVVYQFYLHPDWVQQNFPTMYEKLQGSVLKG